VRHHPHNPRGRPAPATYSEAAFQADVVRWARLNRWRHFHPHDSRRSNEGWPDLALWRPETGEFLLVELKTQKGRLTRDQRRVIDELRTAGVEVHLWRPSDWAVIERRLRMRWTALDGS
jgi:VRR-NUC domain